MINYLLRHSLIPKTLYRLAIHMQLRARLKCERKQFLVTHGSCKTDLIQSLKTTAIALSTKQANEQHYEVPTEFYRYILGPQLKYSCNSYQYATTLDDAEKEMLEMYCQRAAIKNGQHILDLGCGWGSFALYAAKKFPHSSITAVSNSQTQKEYIDRAAQQRNLDNLNVITCDANNLSFPENSYDRIISIEMFEHMRNYELLFKKIHTWLKGHGKLFIHHFCHQYLVYPFNPKDSWMAKHFFADGLMPSEDLMLFFSDPLSVEQRWRVNGKHYARTCYQWLDNLYHNKREILQIFAQHYADPKLHYQYWDLFIRACAQLFAFKGGNEWFVSHYLLAKNPDTSFEQQPSS